MRQRRIVHKNNLNAKNTKKKVSREKIVFARINVYSKYMHAVHSAHSNTLPWFSCTLGHILIYFSYIFFPLFCCCCWMLTNHNEANIERQIYDIHLFFRTNIHIFLSTINFPDHDSVYNCTSANASAGDFFSDIQFQSSWRMLRMPTKKSSTE